MNFNQLGKTLHNGFHDAELHRLEMDYVRRRLKLELVVWIGHMGDVAARELYRPARVTLADVAFLVIEPPDADSPSLEGGPVVIDTGEGLPRQSASLLPEQPSGTVITWMYIEELNRFLLFAAGSAVLEWIGPEENRTRRPLRT
jgi:hypothetical protein